VILVMSYVKAQLGGPVAGWLVPVTAANKTMGGLLGVFVALGLPRWLATCRLARGQILSLKAREYVEAARALAATLGAPKAILLEASLSSVSASVRRLPAGD
jgi:ABC-type dipeptide/oligopeptide/nickel transport system permease subunit